VTPHLADTPVLQTERLTLRAPAPQDADAFVAYIERIGPILECIERRKLFVDGNTVCAILNLKTTMEGMRLVPLVELATIVDGKITGLEVFFDATAYNRMFEPD
jgi:hypothetical protein